MHKIFRVHMKQTWLLAMLLFIALLPATLRADDAAIAASWDLRLQELVGQFEKETDPLARWLLISNMEELEENLSDPQSLDTLFQKLADLAPKPLWLHERLLWTRLHLLRQAGKYDDAAALAARLGFIDTGYVAGPFDNEGSAGMEEVYEPEKTFVPGGSMPGKLREVRWRPLPKEFTGIGWIPFNRLMYPQDKVTGYLAVAVSARKNTTVRLALSFAESLRVWLNGDMVYEFLDKRELGEEAESIPLRLRRGDNLLLFKVGGDGGSYFGLGARLTGLKKLALPRGVTISGDPQIVKRAAMRGLPVRYNLPQASSLPHPARIAARRVETAKGANAEVAALVTQARVLHMVKNFDRQQHVAEDALARAAAMVPFPTQEMLLLWARITDEPKVRSEALEDAYLLDPHNPVLVQRFVPELEKTGASQRAVHIVREAKLRHPDNGDIELMYLDYLGGLTHPAQTYRRLKALHQQAPRNRRLLRSLISVAEGLRFGHEALRLREQWATWDQDGGNLEWLQQHHLGLYHAAQSLNFTERLLKLEPYNIEHLRTKAELLAGMGYEDQARALFNRIQNIVLDSPWFLDAFARFESLHGNTDAAIALWKRELLVRPQDPELKERLAILERRDNYARPYIEDAVALAATNPPPTDPNIEVQVLLEQRIVKVFENGLSSTYRQIVYRILNEQGKQNWRYVWQAYHGGRQEVQLKKARILRPGEGEISPLPSNRFPAGGGGGTPYDMWVFAVTAENVKVGDVVEVQMEMHDTGADNIFHDYFGDLIIANKRVPVQQFRYTLIAPTSRVIHYSNPLFCPQPAISVTGPDTVYAWRGEDLPRIKSEPNMVGMAEVGDPLHVSTWEDWGAFMKWYRNLIKDQFTAGPRVRKKVKEITAGILEPRKQVEALYRFVSNEIKYIAIELGIHSFKPYQANEIFERGWGDCKDKATLLIAMLKEIGIHGELVLIRTRNLGYLSPEPASLAMFNHAIVYIPKYDLYLDGTVRFHDTNTLPWQDQAAQVAIVEPDGVRMASTPMGTATDNLRSSAGTLTVTEPDKATLQWRSEYRGVWAGDARAQLQDRAKQNSIIEKMFNNLYPGSRLVNTTIENIDDESKPVYIDSTVDMNNYIIRQDSRLLLPVSMTGVDFVSRFGSLSTRTTPQELRFPFSLKGVKSFKLPPGYTVQRLPEPQHLKSDFGTFDLQCRPGNPELNTAAVCETNFSITVFRVEPEDYPAFREYLEKAAFLRNQYLEVGHE